MQRKVGKENGESFYTLLYFIAMFQSGDAVESVHLLPHFKSPTQQAEMDFKLKTAGSL